MDGILGVFFKVTDHVLSNISDYLLAIGVIFIQSYIYLQFGGVATLLSVGITFILASIIIELNKKKRERHNHYR